MIPQERKLVQCYTRKKLSAETEETKIGRYRKGKLTAGTGETNCQQVQERKKQSLQQRKKILSGSRREKEITVRRYSREKTSARTGGWEKLVKYFQRWNTANEPATN